MKIDTVVVASNDNPEYYLFYPYIKPFWEKFLKARCILIYIGHELPKELVDYKEDIILYKPIEGIHTAFIAQNVRLLFPCLFDTLSENKGHDPNAGVLITDVDSIPMCSDYFLKQIEPLANDLFINYSFDPAVFAVKEHNIPYCVATARVWKEIFKIGSLDEIETRLKEWNQQNGAYHFDGKYRSKCVGFHFDQQTLFKYVEEWNSITKRLHLFELKDRKRFLPEDAEKIKDPEMRQKIINGYFVDNFFLRPYRKKKGINHQIFKLLLPESKFCYGPKEQA